MKTCSKCSYENDDTANFCEQCGALLSSCGEAASERFDLPSPTFEEVSPSLSKDVLAALTLEDLGLHLDATATGELQPSFEMPTSEPTPIQEGDCPYVKLECQKNLFFITGVQMPIQLRATPMATNLEKLHIWMIPQVVDGTPIVYNIPVKNKLVLGQQIRLQCVWRPEANYAGTVPFDFYVVCLVDGKTYFYTFNLQVLVIHADHLNRGQNIAINISASEAATISADFGRQLASSQTHTLATLTAMRNQLSTAFDVCPLYETAWRPADTYASGRVYLCDALTIKIKKKGETEPHCYQLLSQEVIRMGRKHAYNHIVVADPTISTDPHDYPNNAVSAVHTEILYQGHSLMMNDKSTHGTYVNGIKPPSSGYCFSEHAPHHTVEFGYIKFDMYFQYCRQRPDSLSCTLCPQRKLKSVVFKRSDAVPESYLLVWQCCDLGLVDKDLSGLTILRRNGGFILKTFKEGYHYLAPSERIFQLENGEVEISSYHQYGDVKIGDEVLPLNR